mgnify:CR=1 FL=1
MNWERTHLGQWHTHAGPLVLRVFLVVRGNGIYYHGYAHEHRADLERETLPEAQADAVELARAMLLEGLAALPKVPR